VAIITKNIKTDFGAVGNGTADDAPKFNDFGDWCIANQGSDQIVLTIPSGTYLWDSGDVNTNNWTSGINDLHVVGESNPTLQRSLATGGHYFFLGGGGQVSSPDFSARLQSVLRGSTTVNLIDVGDASLFNVNDWALITGFCLQADGGGYPSNPQWFEWVEITDISSSTITLSAPLRYTYLSTWPVYDDGTTDTNTDQGGPATLYAIPQSWNCTHLYEGFTVDQPEIGVPARGRVMEFLNVSCPTLVPTQTKLTTITNNTQTGSLEVDKLITELVWNSVTSNIVEFQTGSVDIFRINDCTITSMQGGPKRLIANNSTITTFAPGCWAYGRSDEIELRDCVVPTLALKGILHKGPGDVGVNVAYTMVNGVIIIPDGGGGVMGEGSPPSWAVPDTWCFWSGQKESETGFRINNVTRDSTNTYVHTSLSGGFPDVPLTSGKLFIQTHPCPQASGSGNTGSAWAVDLNNTGAQNKPLFSYSNRTYTGSDTDGEPEPVKLWGRIVSVVVTVTQAYTGVQPTLTAHIFNPQRQLDPDNSVSLWDPDIDLKEVGTRTITADSVTGAVGNDTLVAPGAVWFCQDQQLTFSEDVSGEASGLWPIFTVEVTTDQGVVPSFVAPLNLRLAS
jgi:hypothetical protein